MGYIHALYMFEVCILLFTPSFRTAMVKNPPAKKGSSSEFVRSFPILFATTCIPLAAFTRSSAEPSRIKPVKSFNASVSAAATRFCSWAFGKSCVILLCATLYLSLLLSDVRLSVLQCLCDYLWTGFVFSWLLFGYAYSTCLSKALEKCKNVIK